MSIRNVVDPKLAAQLLWRDDDNVELQDQFEDLEGCGQWTGVKQERMMLDVIARPVDPEQEN